MKVLLLLSDKSCGSTIVKDELKKHPQVKVVGYTQHNDHETLFWVKAASVLARPRHEFYGGEPLFHRLVARRSIVDLLERNIPGYSAPRDDEDLVFAGFDALCEAHGPVFFEKSPHHLNHWGAAWLIAQWMERTRHDVRTVGLIRNPLAMAYSAWRRWHSDPQQRQYRWAQSYLNLLTFTSLVGEGACHQIRYEDIIEDPVGAMRTITDFVGVPPADVVGRDIHAKSRAKFADDDAFDLELAPEVRQLARRLGYEESALQNPRGSGRRTEQRHAMDRFAARWRGRRAWVRKMYVAPMRSIVERWIGD